MKTKKTVLTLATAFILVGVAVLFKRIVTMLSIRRIGGKLYKADYRADYKLDKLLAKGLNDVEGLVSFLSKEIYLGYPIKINEDIIGCTSFAATSPTGALLVGRNFDYARTGMLLLHTKPKKGYASYSMACLEHLNISEETNTMPETLMGKLMILSAPFACVDGINEMGLHVSVLQLETEPTAQSTGKKNIITTVAVRMLLDKCASTAEAIAMLDEYDMFSSAGSPYHFFISDRNGRSVVVEWPEQKMVVLEATAVTNFQLAEGRDKGVGIGHDRYATVMAALEKSRGVLDEDEVMQLLEAVRAEWNGKWLTLWSIVYNLSDFSLKICCEMDYGTVYEM